MFRGQVRRLRALEGLATRVAAGDLAVRVGDSSPDQIGRLARQLDRMTEAMADDRRQLHASDEQRRKLLANISHELATPLTSIRGFAETLLDPSIAVSDEERTDYLHRVLDEAQRLDLLTRDVLDLARLEAGSPLTLAALDFAELCRNTVERFGPAFATAGLRLEWLGPLERAPIVGDGRRLEQLLDNLLMNALRYVPRGGRVEVSLADAAGAEPGAFLLAVQDDGPGHPTADLPQIFERFYRADATRVVPGSGAQARDRREIVSATAAQSRRSARYPRRPVRGAATRRDRAAECMTAVIFLAHGSPILGSEAQERERPSRARPPGAERRGTMKSILIVAAASAALVCLAHAAPPAQAVSHEFQVAQVPDAPDPPDDFGPMAEAGPPGPMPPDPMGFGGPGMGGMGHGMGMGGGMRMGPGGFEAMLDRLTAARAHRSAQVEAIRDKQQRRHCTGAISNRAARLLAA
jgi:hypothetical protein